MSQNGYGPSEGPLEPSLGSIEVLLGRLEAIWEAPGALLGCRRPGKARTLTSFKDLDEHLFFLPLQALLGGPLVALLGVLGTLGPS